MTMPMRRSLQLSLVASLVLSAIALWPSKPPEIIGVVERAVDARLPSSSPAGPVAAVARAPAPLPERLAELDLSMGSRELFLPVEPKPTQAPPPPSTASIMPTPQTVALPTMPTMDYRFWGRMQTPEGAQMTLLARGDQVLAVKAGTELEGGFRVEAVEPHAVRISYPQFGTLLELPIPQPTGR